MAFLVSADGHVIDSKVEKTSGYKNLDKAAIKAISGLQVQAGHEGRRSGADLDQSGLRLEPVIER
jgi:TonB family protein